jgi:endonuclease-3
LELTKEDDPAKIERDLMKLIPRDKWIAFSHQMIHHGRKICNARKPLCLKCSLEKVCGSKDKILAFPASPSTPLKRRSRGAVR